MTKETTVTYRAKSLFISKTFLVNAGVFLVAILQMTEIVQIIPPSLMKYAVALVAMINVALRLYTVRPASATLMPGDTKTVQVEKL